jgi:CDP-4-dehydro-6-deoxyglucose reductase/3-phenylpropionate/trans-cinnamate dioxygenase ferredoxin reductase subunit
VSYQVTVADGDVTFGCEPGSSVLDAAEDAGWALPYSCRKGVCDSCVGALLVGEVDVHGATVTGPADRVLLCQARPRGPVTIRPRRITSSGPPLRKKLTVVVHRVLRPAPRVTLLELRFPIGRRAPFRAGQYLNVFLPDGDTRPYSLANSPEHNDAAELHVRTETGGLFSERIAAALRRGDTLEVETPFGEVFAPEGEVVAPEGAGDGSRPLILLATGTGFAPMKSIVLDHAYRRRTRPIHLYWGGRTESDLYLADLAGHWARRYDWFTFTPVLSRPGAGWAGRTGHVQDVLLADRPDLRGHAVYACGSEAMTASALAVLSREAGLAEDQFHADAFVPVSQALAPA